MRIVRDLLLRASRSRWLEAQFRRRRFAARAVARFLPGETLDAALAAAEALRARGCAAVLTLLGENVTDAEEAEAVSRHYLDVLDRVRAAGLDAQISVKPTQLGLDLGVPTAFAHLRTLARRAAELGNFVWIDMEGSEYTDRTLALYRRLRDEHENVGVCLQSYLYRTPRDLADLLERRAAIRLVKGAYREPPHVAYRRKRDVDEAYARLARTLLEAARDDGARPAFGTHDLRLVALIRAEAERGRVPRHAYEFQMLYGIQRDAQARLAADGYRMRVLVSYGDAWFPWFMRRLAERPANLWFVVRSVLGD